MPFYAGTGRKMAAIPFDHQERITNVYVNTLPFGQGPRGRVFSDTRFRFQGKLILIENL